MRSLHEDESGPSTTRVDELRRLATAIESSDIARFDPERIVVMRDDLRARMCSRLLQRNIQQLLAAADHLREIAWTIERTG